MSNPRDLATPFNEASFLEVADPELLAMVSEDMLRGYAAKKLLAKQESELAFQAASRVEYAIRDGWNEADTFLEIDPVSFAYWSQRLGRDCWSDKQFRKEYARDNPGSVRKNITGRTIITSGFEAA